MLLLYGIIFIALVTVHCTAQQASSFLAFWFIGYRTIPSRDCARACAGSRLDPQVLGTTLVIVGEQSMAV